MDRPQDSSRAGHLQHFSRQHRTIMTALVFCENIYLCSNTASTVVFYVPSVRTVTTVQCTLYNVHMYSALDFIRSLTGMQTKSIILFSMLLINLLRGHFFSTEIYHNCNQHKIWIFHTHHHLQYFKILLFIYVLYINLNYS